MLAPGHALSGLMGGLATAPAFGLVPTDRTFWAYVSVWTGAALLPDIDAKGSTADKIWGPFSSGVRVRLGRKRRTVVPGLWSFVRPFVGGHRRGTHATVGLLTVLVLVWLSQFWSPSAGFFVALGTGLGLRGIALPIEYVIGWKYRRRYWKWNLLLSVAAGIAFVRTGGDFPNWLPWAMFGGSLVHVLGDLITDGKVRLDWPFNDRLVGLPKWLAFRVGGWFEHLVITPWLAIGCALLFCYRFGYDPIYDVMMLMRKL